MPRQLFTSRLSSILALMGVSIGLGNVWRFPYMMGKFGGSAFLVVYVLFTVLFAVPALEAELALGRESRKGPLGAFVLVFGQHFGTGIGYLLLFTVLIADSYYIVVVGNVFFNSNGQDFDLKGLEMQLVARPWEGWTIQAAGSWNHSEQTNSPQLLNNNPDSPDVGQPIVYTCGGTYFTAGCTAANAPAVANVYGPKGSPTANAPPIQTSVRIRYDWVVNDLKAYVQVGTSHVGHSFTQAGSNPPLAADGLITTGRIRFEDPPYSTWDAAVGCARGNWNLALVAENLTDSNKAVFTSTDQFIVAQTPLRPRVIALNFGYKF